ncbi:MAG: prephenate dehydratase domain-containing protein [Bacteroidota bacterium]
MTHDPRPTTRVAFQGEIGAFSEEAVRAFFGPDVEPVARPSFRAVFEAVKAGTVDQGLVPIENARFGSVHVNYDLLREFALPIVGEVHLRIRHHLMARPGTALADVRRVRSHPQALGQCDAWLRAHLPAAKPVADYDTAGAARRLADPEHGGEALAGEAAIASAAAAEEYGLTVLAAGIEGDENNVTRFLAIERRGDEEAERRGGNVTNSPPGQGELEGVDEASRVLHPDTTINHPQPLPRLRGGKALSRRRVDDIADANAVVGLHKTSLVFALRANVPGALFKSLAVFALRDLDLLKIESRPLVGTPGQYLFYLDLGGRATDEPVARALDHLADFAARVQVLGSYPVGRRVG